MMLPLSELSAIGMGTYRMSVGEPLHEQALTTALGLGCNLIDTSSNYTHGASEQLIGKVLAEIDTPVFVVTKGGYLSKSNLAKLSDAAQEEIVPISASHFHCIHPDYLEQQLVQSLSRMNRTYVDGYLLHNPEYFLRVNEAPEAKRELYQRLRQAFTWLEEKVQKKQIRYYGISSNTLPFEAEETCTISLLELLKIAKEISEESSFKLLQFPFNIVENQAVQGVHAEGKSLVKLAQKHQLLTFANRPLNANYQNRGLRLAEYPQTDFSMGEMDTLRDRIIAVFQESPSSFSLSQFPDLQTFFKDIYAIPNFQYHNYIFEKKLIPIFKQHFKNSIPAPLNLDIARFKKITYQYTLSKVNQISKQIKNQLMQSKLIAVQNNETLQEALCQKYLELGIDHVLVGMRKPEYVHLMLQKNHIQV